MLRGRRTCYYVLLYDPVMTTTSEEYARRLEAIVQSLTDDELENAITLSDTLRTDVPDRGESYYLLGLISYALGDRGKALKFMDEGFKVAPDDLEFARALAAINASIGNLNDMNYYMKLSLVLDSNPILARVEPESFADPQGNLERVNLPTQLVNAWVRFHQRRYDDAMQYCQAYLELRPDDDEVFRLIGKLYLAQDKPVHALDALRKARELAPDSLENGRELAEACLALGQLDEAREVVSELTGQNPGDFSLLQLAIRIAGYGDGVASATAEVEKLAAVLAETEIEVPARHVHKVAGHERLFVGVLINEQAMAECIDFLEAWFQSYDNTSMRIVGYQLYERPHVGTNRLKSLVDDWREAFDLDDVTLTHVLTNDGVDVLVDLCGIHPGNRQHVLAGGLAAKRVGWLEGARLPLPAAIDAVLSDDAASAAPVGGVPAVSLGAGQVAYGGGSVMLETQSGRATGGGTVFGAVLDVAAVMPSVALWAQVLDAVPGSRLMLGRSGEVEPELASYLRGQFAAYGAGERIEFIAGREGRNAWTELLSKVDVLLDSVVAQGTISTCDALWMGVPVVSLAMSGRTGISGASILSAAGCGAWVAADLAAYVEVAKSLTADAQSLATESAGLRARIRASALCDLKGFAQRMDAALRGVTS